MDTSPEKHHKPAAGLTLLGVLMAIFVLVVVITSTTQLMVGGQQAASVSRENLVAVNAAREGIELAHAVRDTTWFAAEQGGDVEHWVVALCDEYRGEGRRLALDLNQNHSINVVVDPTDEETQLYTNDEGTWSHISANGRVTPYRRVVIVDCQHAILSEGESGDDPEVDPEQITVHSEVSWQSRGIDRRVELSDKMYNWYYPGVDEPAQPDEQGDASGDGGGSPGSDGEPGDTSGDDTLDSIPPTEADTVPADTIPPEEPPATV